MAKIHGRSSRSKSPRGALLEVDESTFTKFAAVAAQDGMKPVPAVEFLMRWAVSQGTLCPITAAPQSLVPDLELLHRQLTSALRKVKIAAAAEVTGDDDDGESWKGGGR